MLTITFDPTLILQAIFMFLGLGIVAAVITVFYYRYDQKKRNEEIRKKHFSSTNKFKL